MNTILVKIVTPEKVVYEKNVYQVSIPTTTGEITILPFHIPLISVVATGELKIKDKDGDHIVAIAGGFMEVRGKNEVVILANNAETATEIDVERAESAKQRAAEQMKAAKTGEDVDFARLQAVIDREMNRIKIARKYRSMPPTKEERG